MFANPVKKLYNFGCRETQLSTTKSSSQYIMNAFTAEQSPNLLSENVAGFFFFFVVYHSADRGWMFFTHNSKRIEYNRKSSITREFLHMQRQKLFN